ncbi:MAG TPA: Appr-1-p processing protein [Bacteroidetes bacterium]|nr:Appr-1-p processing protein [Bacteroidota bacterium]
MKIHVGKSEITVIRGDISEQETDAVVNAANNHLWMGSGVAGALKRNGGDAIEAEAIAKGPIAIGDAVSTSAGALKAKRVIHAAVMGQDLHTNADFIKQATLKSLKLADAEGLSSISFPALGTGVGGFSHFHCASLMIGAAVDYLIGSTKLREVRFVLFDDEARGIFESELRHRFSAHGHSGPPDRRHPGSSHHR